MLQADRDQIDDFHDILVEKTNFKMVYTLLIRWKIIPVGLAEFNDVAKVRQSSDKENNRILYKIIKSRGEHAFPKLMQALQLSNPELAHQVQGFQWNISDEEWSCPPQVYSFSNAKVHGSYRVVSFTENRLGWKKEAENLKKTFQLLQYEGSEYVDPSEKELDELISEFTESKRGAGCYVFALSGHGHASQGEEKILQPNKSYKNVNEILSKICQAPSLFGKPKIIILQICRGDTESLDTMSYSNNGVRPSTSVEIPDIKDTIILRPCLPGYVAYRDVDLGGWFIHVLTQMIEKYARTKDVEEIMIEVSKNFAPKKYRRTESYSPFPEWRYMIPCANAYSFNKFYFLPKEGAPLQCSEQRPDPNGNST